MERICSYTNDVELAGEYTGFNNRNHFVCKRCGYEWDAVPASMCPQKSGCPRCAVEHVRSLLRRNKEEVLSKIHDIHPDVSLAENEYIDTSHKITAVCHKCNNIWLTPPEKLLQGHGCPQCANTIRADKSRLQLNDVKSTLQRVHPTWELIGAYHSCADKIRVKCTLCGAEWCGKFHNILKQVNCPVCDIGQKSKGEEEINRYLTERGISFERQKTFDGCKNIFSLRFDFYIPSTNVCIEYDGEQHFRPIDQFGGNDAYEKLVVRDQIKNSFCHDNGIRLIRIAFTDFHNISDILDDYFGLVNNANVHSKGAKMQNEQNRKS